MRTVNRYHRALICSLVAFLLVTFAVCSSPSLYARPSERGDSQSKSESDSSKHSQENRSYGDRPSYRSDSGSSRSDSDSKSQQQQRSEERRYTPPSEPSIHPTPPPAPREPDQGSFYGNRGNDSKTYRNNYENRSQNSRQEEQRHEQPRYESQRPSNDSGSSKDQGNQAKHDQAQYGNQTHYGSPQNGGTIYGKPSGDISPSKPQDNGKQWENGKNQTNDQKHDRIVTPGPGHTSQGKPSGFPGSGISVPQPKHEQDMLKRTVATKTGTYRKDFADFSKMWQARREQRTAWHNTYNDHNHGGTHININIFPGACYNYYAYDYDPWNCYPSVYGYYYGLFPPYIHSRRVVVYYYPVVTYTYVEIPLTVIYRDNEYHDHGNYYLANYGYQSVGSALQDIERAWNRNDPELLFNHVRHGSKIDVFLSGDYAYTIDSQDYHDMTVDALAHIRTTRFEFYRVRQRADGEVVAYGKHTYYDYDAYGESDDALARSNHSTTTTYISYTLERWDGEWYITEVGSSPNKL